MFRYLLLRPDPLELGDQNQVHFSPGDLSQSQQNAHVDSDPQRADPNHDITQLELAATEI